MLLAANSLAHFFVDGLCAAALFGCVKGGDDFALMLVIYNTLAFSTQCFVGLCADRYGRHSICASASMLLVAIGALIPAGNIIKVVMVGLGNSVFHVAGGAMTLKNSEGRAWHLGVFVAPGCLGLTLGTLWPRLVMAFAAGIVICAVAVLALSRGKNRDAQEKKKTSPAGGSSVILPAVFLTCAVAVRAIGGSAVSFSWKSGAPAVVLMTAAVFLGKTLGGFVCDRLGCKSTAVLSVLPAALLLAFFTDSMALSLLGLFALNLTMPVTLWLLYRVMPDSPGFAFGAAASALWPGTLIGQLFALTGPALWACIILSFGFGLWAILWSSGKIFSLKGERVK